MSKKYPLAVLFPAIEEKLDMEIIKEMLLTLDEERTKFRSLEKDLDELKSELSLWEKMNPFSERDLKGEILAVKVEMEGLAELYHKDISEIEDRVRAAISSVDAFKCKFLMRILSNKVENIQTQNLFSGKGAALDSVKELDKHLAQVFKEQYALCPTEKELSHAFMNYLLVPYHLTSKLDV